MINKDLENKSEIKDLGMIVDENLRFANHIMDKVHKDFVRSVRIRSFSGLYFPVFGLNTEWYGVSLHIQSECGKIWAGKTPNMDTFHAVKANQIMGIIRRTIVYRNKHNSNLLFTILERPHLEYGSVVWNPFLESEADMSQILINWNTGNTWGTELTYISVSTGSFLLIWLKRTKLLMDNCIKHLFEMKSTNSRGYHYAIKIRHSNTIIKKNYFAFRVAFVWDSESSDAVGSIFLNAFKKKLDDHCLSRNIVFDPNYDFLNTYAWSTLLKWLFAIVSFNSSLTIFASWYSSS